MEDPTNSNEFFCLAYGNVSGDPSKVHLLKIDDQGNLLWSNSYEFLGASSLSLIAYGLTATSANDVLISGIVSYDGSQRFFTLKTDLNGGIIWSKTYGNSSTGTFIGGYEARATSDGGFTLVGSSFSQGGIFIKADQNGNVNGGCLFGDSTINVAEAVTTPLVVNFQRYSYDGLPENNLPISETYMCNNVQCGRQLPEIDASPDASVLCPGDPIEIEAWVTFPNTYPILTFDWSPIGTITGSPNDTVIAAPLVTTNYTVLVSDPYGCTASEDVLITVDPCALPIELSDFWITCESNPTLRWETSSENNNNYFTIEWSCDAINFTEIAQIDGLGNSQSLTEYAYEDTERIRCDGLSLYYRLSQTDFDGAHEVLGILSTNCNQDFIKPVITMSNQYVFVSYKEDFDIDIFSADGKLVAKESSSFNQVKLNKLDFRSGIYFIVITSDQLFTERLLIAN